MKYIIFLLILFIGSNKVPSKVKDITDALEYSKDTYFVDDLNYISPVDLSLIVENLEIPNDEVFLSNSLSHLQEDYVRAIGYEFDFNNDGENDLIFVSNYGAEESHTVLWARVKNKYKFVDFFWGKADKLFRSGKDKPYSILIVSGFCCASWIGDYTIYEPIINNDRVKYKKQKNYKIYMDLISPEFVFEPIRFETINENYRLRYSPSIDNGIDTISSEFSKGNILAEFEVGSKGYAISSKKDIDRTWWFVVMDTSCNTSLSFFYNDKNSHKVGWMSSKYVRKINGGL